MQTTSCKCSTDGSLVTNHLLYTVGSEELSWRCTYCHTWYIAKTLGKRLYVPTCKQVNVIFKCTTPRLDRTCFFPCSYSYMIDNIILLITGTLHQRPITELVPKCHPLGSFEEMASINIASTPAELYNAVMIDTPLG